MRLMLQRVQGNLLAPADEDAEAVISRWPMGQGVSAEVKRERNLAHHRKFFALVSTVAAYSEVFDTTEKALVAIKLAAGHCEFLPDPRTGELVAVPKSISFDAMDEDAFSQFESRAIDGILTHILPAMDRQSLELAQEAVLGFL